MEPRTLPSSGQWDCFFYIYDPCYEFPIRCTYREVIEYICEDKVRIFTIHDFVDEEYLLDLYLTEDIYGGGKKKKSKKKEKKKAPVKARKVAGRRKGRKPKTDKIPLKKVRKDKILKDIKEIKKGKPKRRRKRKVDDEDYDPVKEKKKRRKNQQKNGIPRIKKRKRI